MIKQHTPKVVDVPLDFAEWGSGLSLASQADAPPQTRARVNDAFAAADAAAAARLAGPSTVATVSRKIKTVLEQAGLPRGKVKSLIEDLAPVVIDPIRERNPRKGQLEQLLVRHEKYRPVSRGKVFGEPEVWVVEPRGTQGWAVRSGGNSKAYRIFSTRQEAEKDAVARARMANVDGKVFIEIDVKGRGSISPAARKRRGSTR